MSSENDLIEAIRQNRIVRVTHLWSKGIRVRNFYIECQTDAMVQLGKDLGIKETVDNIPNYNKTDLNNAIRENRLNDVDIMLNIGLRTPSFFNLCSSIEMINVGYKYNINPTASEILKWGKDQNLHHLGLFVAKHDKSVITSALVTSIPYCQYYDYALEILKYCKLHGYKLSPSKWSYVMFLKKVDLFLAAGFEFDIGRYLDSQRFILDYVECYIEDRSKIDELLSYNPQIKSQRYNSVITIACRHKKHDLVMKFLDMGIELSQFDFDDICSTDNVQMIKLVVPYVKSLDWFISGMKYAINCHAINSINYLFDYVGSPNEPKYSLSGDIEDYPVPQNMNFNNLFETQKTLLVYSILSSQSITLSDILDEDFYGFKTDYSSVLALLQLGCDPNFKDNDGHYPKDYILLTYCPQEVKNYFTHP